MDADLLKPTVENFGMYAKHNMPCCVFTDRPAVFDCNTGIFHPSRQAEAKGWRLVRADSWFQHFLLRHFFGGPYGR